MPINKVVFGSTTLIDISDTTAVASDVAIGKYFYALDGTKTAGTASGGSQKLTFIEEISIDEATHVIPINFNSSWLNYNYIVFYVNLEISSSSDWIYFQKNTTSINGSVYTNQLSVLNDVGIASKSGSTLYIKLPGTRTISQTMKSGDVLNAIPYSSNKNFKAGSFIRVYGGMFADLV
ncbi:MAG: hypothetical protein K6C34_00785 [Alphaproteobacteria bacterium]|nr:hypothetical protein [Alphaproteobacteria bacterium]